MCRPLFAAAHGDRKETGGCFGTVRGVSTAELLTPENIARIVAQAQTDRYAALTVGRKR